MTARRNTTLARPASPTTSRTCFRAAGSASVSVIVVTGGAVGATNRRGQKHSGQQQLHCSSARNGGAQTQTAGQIRNTLMLYRAVYKYISDREKEREGERRHQRLPLAQTASQALHSQCGVLPLPEDHVDICTG